MKTTLPIKTQEKERYVYIYSEKEFQTFRRKCIEALKRNKEYIDRLKQEKGL